MHVPNVYGVIHSMLYSHHTLVCHMMLLIELQRKARLHTFIKTTITTYLATHRASMQDPTSHISQYYLYNTMFQGIIQGTNNLNKLEI